MWAPSPLWAPLCQGGSCHSTRGRSRLPVPVQTPRQIAFILRVTRRVQGTCPLPAAGADRQSRRKHQTEPWPSFPRLVFPWSQQGASCSGKYVKSLGSFTQYDVRLRFLRYRNWIVWLLMTLFTWCDLLCVQCILVCHVTHEWVPYLFCVIVMCDSNVSTLQIASKPIALCEQFHKNACIKLLSHAVQIAPCERTFILVMNIDA